MTNVKRCPCGCGRAVPPKSAYAARGCATRGKKRGRQAWMQPMASLRPPKPTSTESWWIRHGNSEAPPSDEFYAEAHRRYPTISESTLGAYTGKTPTSTLTPAGWDGMP